MDRDSNNYYLQRVKSKINKLDHKKKQYEVAIIEETRVLNGNNLTMEKLELEKNILQDGYNSLLRLLQKDGMIFEIYFSEYQPHQWENLFIVKTSKGHNIQTKSGNILMMLDENISRIIKDIDKNNSNSLIVIRATDKAALVQLRFK